MPNRVITSDPSNKEACAEIKRDMDRQGVDTLEAGKHAIRWAVVKSSRFDSRAFRTAYPTIYAEYTKPTEARRFTVQ